MGEILNGIKKSSGGCRKNLLQRVIDWLSGVIRERMDPTPGDSKFSRDGKYFFCWSSIWEKRNDEKYKFGCEVDGEKRENNNDRAKMIVVKREHLNFDNEEKNQEGLTMKNKN